MVKFVFIALLALFSKSTWAVSKDIDMYVDITHVYAPDGSKGTSSPLNILVSDDAQRIGTLKERLHRIAAPDIFTGSVNVYDWTNIMHKPDFRQCNYTDAVSCGVINKHWTLQTVVTVGKKFSTVTMKIYNDKGMVIASSRYTAWGKIRWKPQWKLTKINQSDAFGAKKTEVFEMWPPKMEELPPLIKPIHINQARQFLYLSLRDKAVK